MTRTATRPLVGTRRLVRLAIRRDRIILPVWIDRDRRYRLDGDRQLQGDSRSGRRSGSALRRSRRQPDRTHVRRPCGRLRPRRNGDGRVLPGSRRARRADERTGGRPAHPRRRGDRPRRAARLRGRRSARKAHGRAHRRARRERVLVGAAVAGVLAGSGCTGAGAIAPDVGDGHGLGLLRGRGGRRADLQHGARRERGRRHRPRHRLPDQGRRRPARRRAAKDVAVVSAWPSWLSPIGWGQQVRAFYLDRWWIAGLFVALTLGPGHRGRTRSTDVATSGRAWSPHGPGPASAAPGLAHRRRTGLAAAARDPRHLAPRSRG